MMRLPMALPVIIRPSDPFSLGEGTDWINTIGRTAMYQNYALSLSGGTKKTSYYVSLSYNNTEGVIRRSGQERITGRVSLTHQLFNWMKVGYTGNYTWRHNDENLASIGGTGWWNSAIYLSPTIKPMDDYNPFYYSGQKINTPLATILLNTNYQVRHSTNHTGFIEIEPIKNLRFKVSLPTICTSVTLTVTIQAPCLPRLKEREAKPIAPSMTTITS